MSETKLAIVRAFVVGAQVFNIGLLFTMQIRWYDAGSVWFAVVLGAVGFVVMLLVAR
jgi:hypothetical protein